MAHSAATRELLDAVCSHFAGLTQSSDAKQLPVAQAVSNVMWSFATLGYAPQAGDPLDKLCLYLIDLLHSSDARQRPNAQDISNVVWSLGTIGHTPQQRYLLDKFCVYFTDLLRSKDMRAHPNAQNISSVAWSLDKLKHAPPESAAFAWLQSFVAICKDSGHQVVSQNISNLLLACAELRLSIDYDLAQRLAQHWLQMHVDKLDDQGYCNAAWSLAVMGVLDMTTFDNFLLQLTRKHQLLAKQGGGHSTPEQLTTANVRQLYQALAWLKPLKGSQQMEAWSSLRSRLHRLAPEPPLTKLTFPAHGELYATLSQLKLQFQVQAPCGCYRADAVLTAHGSSAAQAILMIERPQDTLTNAPTR